jgi:hypothetical protein
MGFKIIAGPYLNHLTRMIVPASADPTMLTLFPVSNAYDNRSSRAAIYSVAQEDSTIVFDLNLISGGTFENGTEAGAWTMLGVGTIASNNGESHEGAASGLMTLGSGASEVIAYQDVLVRSGEELTILASALEGDGDGAVVRIRNRQTGRWLDDQGVWQDALTNLFAETTGNWTDFDLTFAVEDIEITKTDTVTLRVYLRGDNGTAWFDAVALFPSVSWCSIHGHNLPPFIVPKLQQRDAPSGGWTTEATMTLRRDSFHEALADLEAHRYWRVLFEGRPDTGTLIHVGEIVLGQYQELDNPALGGGHNPAFGGSLQWHERQTRLETDLGEAFVHLHNAVAPQRQLTLTFNTRGTDEYEVLYRAFFRGSRGGSNTIVIAPTEMDENVVILGRVQEGLAVVKQTPDWRTGELDILELPLPSVPDIVHVYDAPVEGD